VNWDYDEDGVDGHCVHCGAQIYDTGSGGPINCPSCGKNRMKADGQNQEHQVEQMETAGYWFTDMETRLRSTMMWFEMMFFDSAAAGIPMPDEVETEARRLHGELKKMADELSGKAT